MNKQTYFRQCFSDVFFANLIDTIDIELRRNHAAECPKQTCSLRFLSS